ncbi:PAP/fibrillin family protein [Cyanobium sp. FGCU-6]|jgi:hypothetical protein|nr:PAP/fibrillin family protein [Cyanobium sp. FGCU6]
MAEAASAAVRQTLLRYLQEEPSHPDIPALVEQLERVQPADLEVQAGQLRGVWELRWSSATQPWLKQAPWLENLQVLDPERGRGMNLLRLKGPLGAVAAISVIAELVVSGRQRVTVTFRRGGWIGPRLGGQRLELLASVKQSFPAWLDITVLDDELRLCRGNAGTVFALLRRLDLEPEALLPAEAGSANE